MKDLVYGPLNKTLHTQTLELLIKTMLHAPESVNIKIKMLGGKSTLVAQMNDEIINLSKLLKRANFQHICLDEKDSEMFFEHNSAYNDKFPVNAKYASLTKAEMAAIKDYTLSGNYNINHLLHDDLSKLNTNVNTILLKALLISSGINKLHDNPTHKVYRGENGISESEINQRIKLVNLGGDYTQETPFKSTSKKLSTAQFFSSNKCILHIENHQGKDISGLSLIPFESELLLSNDKFVWKEYKRVGSLHTFTAQVVNPLDDERDEVNRNDIELAKRVKDFAQSKAVDVGFITAYNQSLLQDSVTPTEQASIFNELAKYLGHKWTDVTGGIESLLDTHKELFLGEHKDFRPKPEVNLDLASNAMPKPVLAY